MSADPPGMLLVLTTLPDADYKKIEDAAKIFWDEVAAESPTKAKVVEIIKKYNETMEKAGKPYR